MAVLTVAAGTAQADLREAAAPRTAKGPEALAPAAVADPQATEVSPQSDVRHIGKYAVSRYLGHGAMGHVYLGQHPELLLQVAIKVIDERHAADLRYRRQFLQEARLASQINHPNVIRIYDADQDGDTCFMVQEYVDGGDVAALLRRARPGGLPLRDALRIATGVAAGLSAAEKLHIVHRDVKPSNILISRGGEPKLADLGLARKTDHASDTTSMSGTIAQPGSTVGTPAYMAPEQILTTGQVDIRADIYSLGATLFEMVTGQAPFPGTSTEDVLRRHLHDPLRDPRTLNPRLPRRVAQLIMRMLAKRPEDRPPSAAALLHDLERIGRPHLRRALLGWSAGLLLAVALLAVLLTRRAAGADDAFVAGMSHFSANEYGQALPLLQAARQRRPSDHLLLYVLGLCHLNLGHLAEAEVARNELAAASVGSDWVRLLDLRRTVETSPAATTFRSTVSMICNLAALAKAPAAEQDNWTSTPVILVFQPPETTALAPSQTATWIDDLEAMIVQRDAFPVVNRSALDFILRELLLSQTGVVTPDVRLRLGRLLPASVLVKSNFSGQDGQGLSLRLVDVESSAVIGGVSREPLDPNQRQATLASLVDELVRCLAHQPARGVIDSLTGENAKVNIGRYHGLVVGQELAVYRSQKEATAGQLGRLQPTARVRVATLDRFSATVSLLEAREAVTPGMFVQASAPGA